MLEETASITFAVKRSADNKVERPMTTHNAATRIPIANIIPRWKLVVIAGSFDNTKLARALTGSVIL